MADTDAQQWNGDAARDAARETDNATWNNGGRSPSPRGAATPPRRERERSRSPIRVDGGEDRGRADRGHGNGGDNNPGNNLHVSGLSNKTTDRDLEDAFGKYGSIQKAQVMYDPHSREPRGFAFVTFDKAEDADAAITAMNGTEFLGRKIHVEKARRGRARTPTPGRYFGPPKKGRDGPPGPYGGGGGYGRGPPRGGYGDDRYGGMPPRGYPPAYPPRDPYDRYGPPPGGRPFSPPPMRGDPYGDRYGRGPPPMRGDYPPRGGDRDYLPPPPRGGPGMDYPPRDFPPRGPPGGDYPPPRGGYRDMSPPPPRGGRYDDLPPPPPRGAGGPGGRYPDGPPRPRYDDAGPPPRRY